MPSNTRKTSKSVSQQPTLPVSHHAAAKQCKCPLEKEHKDKRLFHTERLPMSVQDAYKLVFLQEDFMSEVLGSRKATNYSATQWTQNEELNVSQRTVYYNLPIPIGSKTSSVSDKQTLAPESKEGEVYVVNSEVKNEGIPLADSFVIAVHVCIAKSLPPENCVDDTVTEWCTYSCYSIIVYKKSVWGVIKGQLERSVYSGMEGIHRDVAAALRDYADESQPNSGDNARSSRSLALNARRKRKSKLAGHDSSKRTKDDNSGSGWNHFFLNLVFLLLAISLVTLNMNLLQKVQSLEAVSRNLTVDKVCPPVIAGKLPVEQFDMPQSQGSEGAWALVKSLLASQKATYSSELQQMGNHLQRASFALEQADSELHLVMDRLPSSLDALEDAVQEHVRNEQLVQQINELLRRNDRHDKRTDMPFDVEVRIT